MSRVPGLLALLVLAACAGGEPDIRLDADTSEDPVFEGRVEVAPTALVIPDAVPGERTVGTVEVRNVGEYDLTLVSAALTEDADGVLVTDEATNADRLIGPDRAFEVLIRCTLPTADTDPGPVEAQGSLRVRTRDPDTPTVDVAVRCTSASS